MDAGEGVLSSQRSIRVRENLKYLIEPRDFEDRTHGFLQSSQQEFAAVSFHLLHRLNQRRQTGAVDGSHVRKVDHQALRLFVNYAVERRRDRRGNVQIDFAFERQQVGTISSRRRASWGSVFFHFNLIVNGSPSERIDNTLYI